MVNNARQRRRTGQGDRVSREPDELTRSLQSSLMFVNGKAMPLSAIRDGESFGEPLRQSLRNGTSGLDDYTIAEMYAACLTAWLCLNIRATVLSGTPVQVQTDSGEVIEGGLPISDFVNNSMSYLWLIEASLLLWGKAFLRKRRNAGGFPSVVEWLNPVDVQVNYDPVRQVIVNYSVNGEPTPVLPSEMIFLREFNAVSDIEGVSRYQVALRRMQIEENIVKWAGAFFFNSARPDGILSYEGNVTPAELQEHENKWRTLFRGAGNAFKTFVAGAAQGVKWTWTPIQASPVDLALKELKDDERVDICAAFEVHPSLAGFSMAADPLSASNTLREQRNQHLDFVTTPRMAWICQQLTDQWIKPDFRLQGMHLKLVPDLSGITANTRATLERSQTVDLNLTSGVFTVNEGREFIGKEKQTGHIDRNPAWAVQAYSGGLIKRSRAQIAIGEPPDLLLDGYVNEINPPPAPMGFGMGSPFGPPGLGGPKPLPQLQPGPNQSTPLPKGHAAAPVGKPSLHTPPQGKPPGKPNSFKGAPGTRATPGALRGGPSSYMILSLAGNEDLQRIAAEALAEVQTATGAVLIPTPPAELHVTLCHSALTPPGALVQLAACEVYSLVTPALHVIGLSAFNNSQTAIILEVELTPELAALQTACREAYLAAGCAVSDYSLEDAYTPHIIIAYGPADLAVPELALDAELTPAGVQLSQDDYRVVAQSPQMISIEGRSVNFTDAAVSVAMLRELDQWRTKVKTKGAAAPFVPAYIDERRFAWIRNSLDGLWPPATIFEAARGWIRDGVEPGPFGATPEQAEAYWRNFDALSVDLESGFLEYLAAGSAAIYDEVIAHPAVVPDVHRAFEAHNDKLIAAWIGTADAPGPLTKLFIAGMGAGNDALNGAYVMPPTRAGDFNTDMDWQIDNNEAIDFAKRYSYELIKGINDTTRDKLQSLMSTSVADKWPVTELRKSVIGVLIPPGGEVTEAIRQRAALIADTEKMRVYNQGAFDRWQAAGVDQAIWQTVQDDHVCPICRPLHGVTAAINEGWLNPVTGKRYFTLAHPRCRCFRQPVVKAQAVPPGRLVETAWNKGSVIEGHLYAKIAPDQADHTLEHGLSVTSSAWGKGVQLDTSPFSVNHDQKLVTAYVNIHNPLKFDQIEDFHKWVAKNKLDTPEKVSAKLIKDGYDSLIAGPIVIALDPEAVQVAKVGDKGSPYPKFVKTMISNKGAGPASIPEALSAKASEFTHIADKLKTIAEPPMDEKRAFQQLAKLNLARQDAYQAWMTAKNVPFDSLPRNPEEAAAFNANVESLHAEYIRARDEELVARKAAQAAQAARLEQVRIDAIKVIVGDNLKPANVPFKFASAQSANGPRGEAVKTASSWLSETLSADRFDNIRPAKILAVNGRAYYMDGTGEIRLDNSDPSWVAVHEWGHLIEDSDPELHARAVEFLLMRAAKDREPVKLSLMIPGSGYGPNELAYPGNYPDPYVGKVYKNNLGAFRATEVISMGLQYMFQDPAAFAVKDPEYFNFILSIMRGYL